MRKDTTLGGDGVRTRERSRRVCVRVCSGCLCKFIVRRVTRSPPSRASLRNKSRLSLRSTLAVLTRIPISILRCAASRLPRLWKDNKATHLRICCDHILKPASLEDRGRSPPGTNQSISWLRDKAQHSPTQCIMLGGQTLPTRIY